jgi:hypothetical protein
MPISHGKTKTPKMYYFRGRISAGKNAGWLSFFYPDFTVDSGVSPDLARGRARGL